MPQDERDYYALRAATEWERANKATDRAIGRIHAEMAERYEMLAIGERARPLSRQSTG